MEAKILVIGDIMLDRYIYGTVERISPEAPVPVLNYKNEKENIGGCGVVAESLSLLNCNVELITRVGNDEEGKKIIELCEKLKIERKNIFQIENYKTIVKTRFVALSPFWQYIMRMDKEEIVSLDVNNENKVIHAIRESVKNNDIIVISDYKKGFLTEKIIKNTLEEAIKNNKKVIVDTKGKILEYKGAHIIAPNRRELSENLGEKIGKDIESIEKAAKKIGTIMECDVIVKLGEDGVFVWKNKEKKSLHLKSEAQKVVNVSGAGDVFIAALAFALSKGYELEEAAKIANRAASIAIGKEYPRITREEINV